MSQATDYPFARRWALLPTHSKCHVTLFRVYFFPYSNGFFSNMITAIVGYGVLTYAEARNGEGKQSTGYVMNITKHGDKFDADLYLRGIEEDFILEIYDDNYETNLFGDYGTISIRETNDTSWPEKNAIDLSTAKGGTTSVKSDKEWTIIWALPENDNNSYRVTFNTEAIGLSQKWSTYSVGGGAGRPYSENFVISRTENTNGFITLYCQSPQEIINWTIEKL